MNIRTICIHGASDETHKTGAIVNPIYQTATFAHIGVGQSTGYDYTRTQNPTREHLEKTIANLESGYDALAFSSGMAAIAALMELFEPGDEIVASTDLYGGSIRLFDNISTKNGLKVNYVKTWDIEDLKRGLTQKTKGVFVETPTNPMMHVTDIQKAAEICKERKILLAVDNTFLSPYYQRPLLLGADIAIHSGTKYLGGHNDTLSGFLVAKTPLLSERLRYIHKTSGAVLSPFDCFLVQRGLKTLAVRMDRQSENARILAEWLSKQEKVKKVYYVGLDSHPDIEVSKKQSTGFGSMISFEAESGEAAVSVLGRLKIVQFAESLGGVDSLITYPLFQTHADVPRSRNEENGVNERLLRLSVGLEDIDDLIADFEQALK
ncbi:MAG: PLP-dependent aspartate aminotransferase family protein [Clostridiales bacterium]|nr:PLP-dependent aspartate aminotransferase family protein [Clostridiales bacterium]